MSGGNDTRLPRPLHATWAVLLACLALLKGPTVIAAERSDEVPVVAGYLASWSASPVSIAALPADRLTHIVYAFGVTAAGGVVLGDPCRDAGNCAGTHGLGGNLAALAQLKRGNPHLRILLALGGWTGSVHFSDAAASPEARQRFVRSALDLAMVRFGKVFDGIDIDWEYPVEGGLPGNTTRPEDRANLTKLIVEFRRQLDALVRPVGHRPLLTIAVPASPWLAKNIEVRALSDIVDWVGVMGYDYHSGAQVTGFNAPLFPPRGGASEDASVDTSIQAYLAAGVPPSKLVLGIPFYGRAYGKVAAGPSGDGLSQPAEQGAAEGWGSENIDYRALATRDLESRGFKRYWHELARVPWLYNLEARVWISYDDARSISAKAAYTRVRGLRGVFGWELSADDGSLLEAIHQGLYDRPSSRTGANDSSGAAARR
jgi:chitinase